MCRCNGAAYSRTSLLLRRLPFGLAAGGLGRAAHGIALHGAGVLGAARGEDDLISLQPTLHDRRNDVPRFQCAGERLELLLDGQLAVAQFPLPANLGGHDPKIGLAE